MIKRFEHNWADFKWVDLEGPAHSDLVKIAEEFSLPLMELSNALEPDILPHCEINSDYTFILLRHFDAGSKHKSATTQELTTKISFFIGRDFVLTLHRLPLPCIEKKRNNVEFVSHKRFSLVKALCHETISSFDGPLDELDNKTDAIEARVFALKRRNILREGYVVKRKVASYRKIFKFTFDTFNKISSRHTIPAEDLEDLRETLGKLMFYADEIHEEISGLINLHLSLMAQRTNDASYRTNEVMRVLTVVSIFFLPLNFITGVYGMNFENMPELKLENGYHLALGAMATVVLIITFWIYKKGWIKKDEI